MLQLQVYEQVIVKVTDEKSTQLSSLTDFHTCNCPMQSSVIKYGFFQK